MGRCLVTLQGLVAAGFAIVAVIRGATGHDQSVTNGYGFAAWVAILGGAVLAAGIALLTGRRWGRAIAVVAQLLLLPVAWSLLTDSHQVPLGIVLGVVVLGALAACSRLRRLDGWQRSTERTQTRCRRKRDARTRPKSRGTSRTERLPASVLLSFGGESSEVGAGQAIRGPLRLRVGTE